VCREGILGQFGQIQKVAHAKIALCSIITAGNSVLYQS
jgi:hypothetical protein